MKKPLKLAVSISVVFCLLTFVAAPLAAQCTPPPDGLISWWPAEGDATDLTGGNNGTLTGATTFAAGMVGQAFKFGGADDDAVGVGAAPNLQLQSFSIEGWVSRASTLRASLSTPNGSAGIFAFGSQGYGFGMMDDGRLFLTSIDVDAVFSTSVTVTDLNFHHVAVTKSGPTVIFYVDGNAEIAPAYNTPFSFTSTAAIGARSDNPSFGRANFLGIIDELSVYNRDLAAAEIQAIVAAGSNGKCPPSP